LCNGAGAELAGCPRYPHDGQWKANTIVEWLDRPLGPLRVRGWGLLGNFIANAVALYGLASYLQSGTGVVSMVLGGGLTVLFLLVLATPAR